eukprot:CAMPEP_0178753172 /NCGR_PEP_ID=MMETSP0744-20121128/11467_1 /TAXON_ID=913974 /ORGANISM="Nitzschia punctata, Strain CCMP561" /LENGTH=136 /DNA_ID=CAMNT_0020406965 /DNA_START=425 /DNA_END=835 /DNA_ORIENTATION=+
MDRGAKAPPPPSAPFSSLQSEDGDLNDSAPPPPSPPSAPFSSLKSEDGDLNDSAPPPPSASFSSLQSEDGDLNDSNISSLTLDDDLNDSNTSSLTLDGSSSSLRIVTEDDEEFDIIPFRCLSTFDVHSPAVMLGDA